MDRRTAVSTLSIGVVGAFGVAASVALWQLLAGAEQRALAARVAQHAGERATLIEHRLADDLAAVHCVAIYVADEDERAPERFRVFVAPLLAHAPSLTSLFWGPRVERAERAAHEAAMRSAGFTGYAIRAHDERGELTAAAAREVHYPIGLIESRAAQQALLGFDLGSDPRAREALERAAASGELAITVPLELAPQAEGQEVMLAFLPHYRGGTPPESPEQRAAAVDGYVVGVLDMGRLVEAALEGFDPESEVIVWDPAVPAGAVLPLDADPGRPTPSGSRRFPLGLPFVPWRASPDAFAQQVTLEAGGRSWPLRIAPTEAFVARNLSPAPSIALLGGLAVTALATAYLGVVSGRARRIKILVEQRTGELRALGERLEERVAERTAELAAANEELAQEVAQRKQADAALRDSEERLRLTLDAVSDGGWDWHLPTGNVVLSDSWYTALGYAPGSIEPCEEMWRELIHPADHLRFREVIDGHLAGSRARYECEIRMRRASGEYRWTLDRGAVVERDAWGRPVRVVGAHTDIDERKRAEEEQRRLEAKVRHAQKLESLGVLAGGIAHDFNNLLAGILGNADLALRTLSEQAPEREALDQVLLAGRRAAELVRQMLAYSGQGRVRIERLDLTALVEELARLLEASISKKAEVLYRFDRDTATVEGDATQLRQVAMNLITNASDALGDERGVIEVSTGRRELRADERIETPLGDALPPGCYACLEVADTGCGMDAATRARVFDPFFTTKFRGRGLGMAAVLGIVRAHRGAIQLESRPGKGTTVTLLLPLALPGVPELVEPAPRPAAWRGGTVLFVDDEPALRRLACRILDDAGFDVLEACDGSAAIEVFGAHADIEAVILDLTMPKLGGEEVLRAMREIRPDVRVIVASGYMEEQTLAALADAKPSAFLQKPYTGRELLAKLCSVLDGGRS